MTVVDAATGEIVRPTLESCERIIESGLDTFVEVGNALLTIRDECLYKSAGFKTFESYCKERWNFAHSHAARLMDSAHVAAILSPMGEVPANERQARALAPLKDDPQAIAEAWTEAQQRAREEGSKVTHRIIEEVVAEKTGRQPTGPKQRPWTRHKGSTGAAKVLASLIVIADSVDTIAAVSYHATREEAEGLDRTIQALRKLRKSLVVEE